MTATTMTPTASVVSVTAAPTANLPAKFNLEKASELTPLAKARVAQFKEQIKSNALNPRFATEYSADVQEPMTKFADDLLKQVKTADSGEIGQMITNILVQAKTVNPAKLREKPGFFAGLFKKAEDLARQQVVEFQAQFESAHSQIQRVVQELETRQDKLIRRVDDLEELFQLNRQQFVELCVRIEAGRSYIEEAETQILPAMQAEFDATQDMTKAQEIADFKNWLGRFKKRITDLEVIRTDALQTAPQVRMMQNNSLTLADKINTTATVTVSLWKKNFVIALGLNEQKEAIEVDAMVNDANNALLLANAQAFKDTSVAIAHANQRTVIDVDTLEKSQTLMLETFTEVKKIEDEGEAHRKQVEARCEKMNSQIRNLMAGR